MLLFGNFINKFVFIEMNNKIYQIKKNQNIDIIHSGV